VIYVIGSRSNFSHKQS